MFSLISSAGSNGVVQNGTWYIDSGASHHMEYGIYSVSLLKLVLIGSFSQKGDMHVLCEELEKSESNLIMEDTLIRMGSSLFQG